MEWNPTSAVHYPTVPPTPGPSVNSADEELRKKVDKLEKEVAELRSGISTAEKLRKQVTANQWIQVDRQNCDQVLVVNFEVLNLA